MKIHSPVPANPQVTHPNLDTAAAPPVEVPTASAVLVGTTPVAILDDDSVPTDVALDIKLIPPLPEPVAFKSAAVLETAATNESVG